MINHPANALVVSACIALVALGILALATAVWLIGQYRDGVHARRLDGPSRRETRRKFNQIVSQHDDQL